MVIRGSAFGADARGMLGHRANWPPLVIMRARREADASGRATTSSGAARRHPTNFCEAPVSWDQLREILRAEAGADLAQRVESRVLFEMAGMRLSVPSSNRPRVTDDQIRGALARHGWKVDDAASELGIHPSSVYRRLQPKRQRADRRIVR